MTAMNYFTFIYIHKINSLLIQ